MSESLPNGHGSKCVNSDLGNWVLFEIFCAVTHICTFLLQLLLSIKYHMCLNIYFKKYSSVNDIQE